MSRIITFYSYKGGVGRTLALANIGVLLAKRGKKVLLMDWDLEAPGLDRYFRPYLEEGFPVNKGSIHLLHEAAANASADWRSHVQSVTVKTDNLSPQEFYTLSVIPSGVAAPDYANKVRTFSWAHFFEEQEGGSILERWRDEWKKEYDFVLLDSRTGITDTGGVCTILLPDFLVLVFTANDQSFEGALGIANSAQLGRRHLDVPRPPLTVLPLLSRFDRRDEISLADTWLQRFARDLKPFYDDWLPKPFLPMQMLEKTKVPYITRFSFGEPLPVLSHSLTDQELPGSTFETVVRLLASDFHEAGRIIDPMLPEEQNAAARVRGVIQQAPINERELHAALQAAEIELGSGQELYELLNEVGQAFRDQRHYEEAERYFRRALALAETVFGPSSSPVSISLDNFASVLQEIGRFSEAEPMYWRALAIAEQTFGPEHPKVATGLNNLAVLLRVTGRHTEAEPMFRRALAINEQSYGPEHPTVATSLNNLAGLLRDINRLAEAEPMYRRALAIDEKSYGPEHHEVAIDLNNLAGLLRETNRLAEAEPMYPRVVQIFEKSYGPEHPTVAKGLNNLAELLRETNRLEEAEPMFRRVVHIFEKSYGPEHPEVATGLNNLAGLLDTSGRKGEAEPLYRRALAINEQSYGPEHPSVALRLTNLAAVLHELNRSGESLPLIQRAVGIFQRSGEQQGYVHPHLADAQEWLEIIQKAVG